MCVRVVPGSNLGLETDYRYSDLLWIFQSLRTADCVLFNLIILIVFGEE
jgi:hypothetical protein